MKRAWVCGLALLAGFIMGLRGAAAAPLDARIPQDAIVYVGWAGADALATPYAQSNLKGVVENTKIGEYIEQNWEGWMEKAGQANADGAKNLDDAAQQLKKIWHHPLALYVGPVGLADPKTPTFKVAMLCDAGADAPALADAYKKMLEKNPAPPQAKLAMALDGTVLIITMGDIKPEAFMVAPGAKPAGLPASATYAAAMKHVQAPGANPAIALYIDAQKVFALVKEVVDKAPDAPPEAKKNVPAVIDALGLASVRQIAYTGGFDQKEWSEQAFVGIQGPRVGLLSLFDAAPISDAALAVVPKEAASMTIGRVDLMKLLALTRDIVGKINPDARAAGETALAAAGKQFDLDIEKNVINALGDEWVSYRGPVTEEGTHPFVFVQKLRDGPAFAKTLDVVETQVNTLAAGRVKIEKIDAGTFQVTGIRLPQITIVWTIRDGYLYISNLDGITGAVDQVEKKGESIVLNPSYKAVRAALPQVKALSIAYSEPAKLYPELYRTLMGLLPMARLAGLDLPADLLPMPKKIASFLTPGGSVSWSDAEGFHFVSRSAMPGAEAMGGQGSPTMMAGAMVGAGTVLVGFRASAAPVVRNSKVSYYVDESTGKESIQASVEVPPLKNDKGEPNVVEVVKISCQNGRNPHVAFYKKYAPEQQKRLLELAQLPPPATPNELRQRDIERQQLDRKGLWIRKPDANSPWVLAASEEGAQILNDAANCPDNQVALRVFPP